MARGDTLRADFERRLHELLELDLGIAVRAGNGRFARQVLLDEGAHDGLLEAFLKIHDVVGDFEKIGDAPRVVHVVERAAAAAGVGGRTVTFGAQQSGQSPLIPELHRQADDAIRIVSHEQRRGRGAIYAAAHGNSYRHESVKSARSDEWRVTSDRR